MKTILYFILGCGFFVLLPPACKQPYLPPVAKSNLGYLVVDGIIISGPDSTIINLSRTQNITDSVYQPNPETGAVVSVIGSNNESFALTEQSSGRYVADSLNLNSTETYQLKIVTSNGNQYLSDQVPVTQPPPIDSLSWRTDSIGVSISLSTHDPQNNTRYYRWDYTETWEYNAEIPSYFDWINNQIVTRDSNDNIYYCWSSDNSTDILIGSSAKLSNDVISNFQIADVPSGSEKINKEYSIIVRQYSITEGEFNFLQNVKNFTEQLGGLFDPQPSEIPGNIHSVNNPKEPVIGYINASAETSARIFISNQQVQPWNYTPYYSTFTCNSILAPGDSVNYYISTGDYTMYGQPTTGPPNYYILYDTDCVDCRLHGGTGIKPSFWP